MDERSRSASNSSEAGARGSKQKGEGGKSGAESWGNESSLSFLLDDF